MSDTLSILVVDDNPTMVKTMADVLDFEGFIVHEARSGKEALAILRDHPMDILVTDIIMPEMDGVALHREARKIHPRLATFLMTAYAADELIQQGMKEGIKAVLTKPVDIDLLLSLFSAIKRMITKPG